MISTLLLFACLTDPFAYYVIPDCVPDCTPNVSSSVDSSVTPILPDKQREVVKVSPDCSDGRCRVSGEVQSDTSQDCETCTASPRPARRGLLRRMFGR